MKRKKNRKQLQKKDFVNKQVIKILH